MSNFLQSLLSRLASRSEFVRRYSPFELTYAKSASFSQFGEDMVLESCFFAEQAEGFYVDVGAFHPFICSNTYNFYRRGWRGINIEPIPSMFRRFPKYRKRDINLNLAISPREGPVEFTVDSLYSGIRDASHTHAGRNPAATTITVTARRLAAILDEHLPPGQTIDFISVDCEGHDRLVLESNDWNRFRPRVILVEDPSPKTDTEVVRYLGSLNYRLLVQACLTKVFVDNLDAQSQRVVV